MQLNQLKSDRTWRAALGMSEAKFRQLAVLFEKAYHAEYEVDIQTKQQNLKRAFAFSKTEDLLFYVLFCQKNPTVHDVRALIFNLPTATADYNFEKGMTVLEKALAAFQPAQQFADLAEFLAYFRHHAHLTLDVTEIYVQRPKDKGRQKEIYSGKKTTHVQIPPHQRGRGPHFVRQQALRGSRERLHHPENSVSTGYPLV